MFISYAQNCEDVWLNRVFEGKNDGFYIDVGSHDPTFCSVTKAFYDRGWSGINIEPVPALHKSFLKERPRDINLQCACGNYNEIMNLYLPPVGQQGVATLDTFSAKLIAERCDNSLTISVNVEKLTDICGRYSFQNIDFLSIDVEGFEKNVLLGMDFTKFRPTVLVIEAVQPFKTMSDPVRDAAFASWHNWEPLLMDAGYVFATFDGLNRYYVRKENKNLVAKFVIPISKLIDNYTIFSDDTTIKHEGICDAFDDIYLNNVWGNGSGPGSNPDFLGEYIKYVQNFIDSHEIRTIVDCGCGDWQYAKKLDLSKVDYKGFDVSTYVIENNNKNYSQNNIQFYHYNGVFSSLPYADLIITKDVLQHLPNKYVHEYISNLNKYKFALITNDIDLPPVQSKNEDCPLSDWRALDLRLPPFSLSSREVLKLCDARLNGTGYKSVLLYENIKVDSKQLSRKAAQFHYAYRASDMPEMPLKTKINSKASTQADIDSPWCCYWTDKLGMERIYHRKIWEQAYVPQALFEAGVLTKGKKGIVFGCGREPLPSLFASMGCVITATDAPQDIGWKGSTMYADSPEELYYPNIVDRREFDKNVTLEYVDMNSIPENLYGQYDFCWSICALEHLGSLQAGLSFIENSLRVLKDGGIAVHTTEFNYANDIETLDTAGNCLYQRKHFESISHILNREGYKVCDLDFDIGNDIFDNYVDIPPYNSDGYEHGGPHLKLDIGGYKATCFGLIIKKVM